MPAVMFPWQRLYFDWDRRVLDQEAVSVDQNLTYANLGFDSQVESKSVVVASYDTHGMSEAGDILMS